MRALNNTVKITYAENFARSANPPKAIVMIYLQKLIGKQRIQLLISLLLLSALLNKRSLISPVKKFALSPNIKPYPTAQNTNEARPNVKTVLPAICPAFFILVEPASRRINPPIIKITKIAPIITQTLFK